MARWPTVPGGGPKSMRSGIYWTRAHLQEERYRAARGSRQEIDDPLAGLSARGAANDARIRRVWQMYDSGQDDWRFGVSATELTELSEALRAMNDVAKQVNDMEPAIFKSLRVPFWLARWVPPVESASVRAETCLHHVMAEAKKRWEPVKQTLKQSNELLDTLATRSDLRPDGEIALTEAEEERMIRINARCNELSERYQSGIKDNWMSLGIVLSGKNF